MTRLVPVLTLLAASIPGSAWAHSPARGVGLGVAAGVNLAEAKDLDLNTSFAWGFFVDIPLLATFHLTPAATVYELGDGDTTVSHTDIDLNFKFIVPIQRLSLGAGVTTGITTGLDKYRGHFGGLGYAGFNVIANLDLFAMGQYKYLATGDAAPDFNNVHVFGGLMFRL